MSRRRTAMDDALDLMTAPTGPDTDARTDVAGYHTLRVEHGPMLDVIVYPMYARSARERVREAIRLHQPTRAAQARCNARRAQERIVRLANCNFGDGDVLLTTTFRAGEGPESDAAAQRIVSRFVDKLRYAWKKRRRQLKYIYTIETTESEQNGKRYHLHILLNAHDWDRDWLESLWTLGACNTRRHQYREEGMGGFAAYLNIYKSDQKKCGKKAYVCSRGLKKPRETRAARKFSPAKMERIARCLEQEARALVEKAYPRYRCVEDVRCTRSDFLPGVYMRVRMRRRETGGGDIWSAADK